MYFLFDSTDTQTTYQLISKPKQLKEQLLDFIKYIIISLIACYITITVSNILIEMAIPALEISSRELIAYVIFCLFIVFYLIYVGYNIDIKKDKNEIIIYRTLLKWKFNEKKALFNDIKSITLKKKWEKGMIILNFKNKMSPLNIYFTDFKQAEDCALKLETILGIIVEKELGKR